MCGGEGGSADEHSAAPCLTKVGGGVGDLEASDAAFRVIEERSPVATGAECRLVTAREQVEAAAAIGLKPNAATTK